MTSLAGTVVATSCGSLFGLAMGVLVVVALHLRAAMASFGQEALLDLVSRIAIFGVFLTVSYVLVSTQFPIDGKVFWTSLLFVFSGAVGIHEAFLGRAIHAGSWDERK
jgi:hypothetical protein